MKNRIKTLLAIGVLTFTMVSTVAMAEEDVDGSAVSNEISTYAEVESYAATETPAAETSAAETSVIETPAAETPQAEAAAVETPQTEAAVYETPETEAIVYETPETEASVYETPQTEAAVTAPQTDYQSSGSAYTDTSNQYSSSSSASSYSDAGLIGSGTAADTAAESSAAADSAETGVLTNPNSSAAAETETDIDTLTATVIAETGLMTEPESHEIVSSSEVSSSIVGFSVDASQYPAADASENTKYIYKYLREEMGLNHAGACGVLANIQMESAFNPLALGDGGTSYGLCQWHNSRFNSLISYCNSNGLDYNTIDGQMAYLYYELQTGYPSVLSYLRGVEDTAQGAYDAGYYWCVHFEMPENATGNGALRGNLASNEYYPLDLSYESSDSVDMQVSSENAVALVRAALEAETANTSSSAIIAAIRELLNQDMAETAAEEEIEAQTQQMFSAVQTIRESLSSGN